MTHRTRMILLLAGLLLIVFSLAALAYAFAPVEILTDKAPVLPTLVTLPSQGAP